jgi:hypothetical protein
MRWSDFEKYLKPEHLAGKRTTVKISRVVVEQTHPRPGKTEQAPVAYFEDKYKGLILSPINQKALQRLFGDAVDNCIGQTVVLEAVTVTVGNRTRTPIRIFASNGSRPEPLPAQAAIGGSQPEPPTVVN